MRNIQSFIYLCLSLVTSLLIIVSCTRNNNDGESHEIDKKYFSESQLFALNLAIESDPDNAESYFKRANIYFERKEQVKALKDIEQAIKLNNSDGKYYLLNAKILLACKKLNQALEAAKISESLKVNVAEIKILLARLYLEMNQKDLARQYLSQASLLTPYHTDILFLNGKFAALEGDTALAISNYFESLRKDTINTEAYKELGGIYFNKQKYDSAMVFITVGRAIEPEDPFFYYIEGKILDHFNLKEASKSSYLNSIKFDSTYADAYRVLGMMYYKNNNQEAAVKYLEGELKYQPNSMKSNLVLAEIYEKQNKGILAIPLLERVVKMDSVNKTAKSSLEKLYILFPKNTPLAEVKVDSVITPIVIGKDSEKDIVVKSVKADTASKKPAPSKSEVKNTKKASESTKEIETFRPLFNNPDSSKIDTRPDTAR